MLLGAVWLVGDHSPLAGVSLLPTQALTTRSRASNTFREMVPVGDCTRLGRPRFPLARVSLVVRPSASTSNCVMGCSPHPDGVTQPDRVGPRKAGGRPAAAGAAGALGGGGAAAAVARGVRERARGPRAEAGRRGGSGPAGGGAGRGVVVGGGGVEGVGRAGRWSDLGLFDTDGLSAQARQAGYTLGLCLDLFVHHFGSRTFAHGGPKTDPAA